MIFISVRKGDQSPGRIRVIDASRELLSYTYDRVHDKTLPKADRWLMSKSIWDEASAASSKIKRANRIKVENKKEAKTRILLEKEAIGHLDELAFLIDVLHMKHKISDDRAEYWTGLVTKTQNIAQAWLKSNRAAYQAYLTK